MLLGLCMVGGRPNMVTVCRESRPEAAHLVSRIELRRCWVVLATQDQYTLIDSMGSLSHTGEDQGGTEGRTDVI